jgi:hypothetical protein
MTGTILGTISMTSPRACEWSNAGEMGIVVLGALGAFKKYIAFTHDPVGC